MTDFLFIASPLALIAYSVCFWRGLWRLGAMVPLLLLVPVIMGDIESAKQGGNLTGVMTLLSSYLALVYLVPFYIAKAFAKCAAQPHGTGAQCAMAALSSLFLFGCVLTVWFVPLLLPVGTPAGMIGKVLYWITGVFCACVVAGYSHDWVLNQQTTDEPSHSNHEVVNSKSGSDDM